MTNIFEGFNPLTKRSVELEFLPDDKDIRFLTNVSKYKKESDIDKDDLEWLATIKEGLEEISDYNNKVDPNHTDTATDYRLIDIPEDVISLIIKAETALGVIYNGGVTNYKKEKLKECLTTKGLTPNGYKWELDYMSFYPEDYNRKLKPKGNWILITVDAPVESAPAKYTIHYATPVSRAYSGYGGGYRLWYASILVNNKEIFMHPREYVVIHDANLLLENIGKGFEMVEGSSSAKLDKNKVFYLKSRGFNQAEIYQILFKSVTNKGFCHFTVDPDLMVMFDNIKEGFMSPEMAFRIHDHRQNMPNFKFGEKC